MNRIRVVIALASLGLVTGCGEPGELAEAPTAEAANDSTKDIGDHVVYFSAFTTDQLSPEIASTYHIVRSRKRAMLNISVIAEDDNASVPAVVTVKTVNLTGQLKNITMRRINEQEAIYYIGETPVANRETLVFDVSVAPEGVDKPADFRFMREFFTDGVD
jgi:hypothetical protein